MLFVILVDWWHGAGHQHGSVAYCLITLYLMRTQHVHFP